jgi:energy-coupling factor transporter ATP-binding protein EcfA2
MNYLESARIEGFWGDKTVEISFNPDVNFLIGTNGSGKTTAINLIAAALNADFHTLDRFSFNSILLSLKEVNGNKKPSIEIIKQPKAGSPYPAISFIIKPTRSEKPVNYALDQLEEDALYRMPRPEYNPRLLMHHRGRIQRDLLEQLRGMVNVSWLSIHRTSYRPREEKSFESSVDQKLKELSNDFVRYFAQLDKQAAMETDKFQQTIFLSLLSSEPKSGDIIKQLDSQKEKLALTDIFYIET